MHMLILVIDKAREITNKEAGWARCCRTGMFAIVDVSKRLFMSSVIHRANEVIKVGKMRMQYIVLIPTNAEQAMQPKRDAVYILICSSGRPRSRR
mmetsp:Transcript_9293/g.13891  ORF Transcript_9293/g.13891 Transcript_9293/m.13891 type:complete len:95 (-) Transcript_9293:308-592(-)